MSLMYSQMGLAVGQAFLADKAGKLDYDLRKTEQKYNKVMSSLSLAQSLNTQTSNEIGVRDAAVRASQAIQISSLQDRASAISSAAAAGVRGGSVTSTLRGLARSKEQAKFALSRRLVQQGRANTQNRRNLALSHVMNQDISVLPKPNSASALLGLGTKLVDIYDSNQPEGHKTTDIIAGWGR